MSGFATSQACADAAMNNLDAGFSLDCMHGHTDAAPSGFDRPCGPASAPADLMEFLKGCTVTEAAVALNVSRGTVHRLRSGYWPSDCRNLLDVWQAYKGRTVKRSTSWFIRRVTADGVRHGGKLYLSPSLAGRAGELLAVARSADGDFLAVALELPAERFLLVRA